MSEQLFIALLLLSVAKRSELRDHAFGDREVFWDLEGPPRTHEEYCECADQGLCVEEIAAAKLSVASGYFGSGFAHMGMCHTSLQWEGQLARDLAKLGGLGVIERNDSTGPDSFSEGVTMPALTLEGVAAEIGIDMRGQDEDFCDPDEDGVCYHPNTGETHIYESPSVDAPQVCVLPADPDITLAQQFDDRGQKPVDPALEALLDEEASYWESKVVREEDIL